MTFHIEEEKRIEPKEGSMVRIIDRDNPHFNQLAECVKRRRHGWVVRFNNGRETFVSWGFEVVNIPNGESSPQQD